MKCINSRNPSPSVVLIGIISFSIMMPQIVWVGLMPSAFLSSHTRLPITAAIVGCEGDGLPPCNTAACRFWRWYLSELVELLNLNVVPQSLHWASLSSLSLKCSHTPLRFDRLMFMCRVSRRPRETRGCLVTRDNRVNLSRRLTWLSRVNLQLI